MYMQDRLFLLSHLALHVSFRPTFGLGFHELIIIVLAQLPNAMRLPARPGTPTAFAIFSFSSLFGIGAYVYLEVSRLFN